MCRILGEVSIQMQPTPAAIFKAICLLSKAGGPDSTGFWQDNFCQFGFNRLAILDTSDHGNQPVLSPSGRYALVFNGEIYNYRDLARRFQIADSSLRSGSDTEIIAHLADKLPFGSLVKTLNGMFAIALWDREAQVLHLARDFAGIKPLFYGVNALGLVFASQFDQIYRHPWFVSNLRMNPQGFMAYMRFGFMHSPETIYEDIHQLNPGCYLEFHLKTATHRVHPYKLFFQPGGKTLYTETDDAMAGCVWQTMNEVVANQMVADVPLGAFLSGGIDSPIVAGVASRVHPDVTALTIGVNDARYNEAEMATSYAKHLQISHLVKYFSDNELLEINDAHFESLHEPFGDYSSLPTFLISNLASKHFKVMLSGDGGDEVFWGYPRFRNVANHANWFKYPVFARDICAKALRLSGRRVSYAVNQFETIGEWLCEQHSHNSGSMLSKTMKSSPLNFAGNEHYVFAGHKKVDTLNFLRRSEFYSHMQRVLTKVDRASMGNGLEVRVPFLDERMLQLAEQIVPQLGIQHQQPKYILNRVVESVYPKELINRKKMGFTVPIREWMQGPLKEEMHDLLLSTTLFGEEFLQPDAMKKHLHHFLQHNEGNEWGIWIVYALQKWSQNKNTYVPNPG